MIASVSRTLDNFFVKICVIVKRVITNIKKISNEKDCDTENNTKNQKDIPNVTTNDLNLGEENSNLNWIN